MCMQTNGPRRRVFVNSFVREKGFMMAKQRGKPRKWHRQQAARNGKRERSRTRKIATVYSKRMT